ncbi:MAG: hypothetical protein IKV30_03275 [Clostridia bacterium]|nr:hypothetical protein [Clostridia bacterium]
MNKVTFFDVEYANSKNKSICQIGLMCNDLTTGDPVYPELDIYINPEDGFDDVCVRIHGISADKVKNEPTFPEVWKTIEKYFTNTVVIGHNVASSDLDSLTKNLTRYNIDIPELYYVCTYNLSREYVPSYAVKDYSLSTLCEFFDIDIDSEHNAFDDACACSDLLSTLVEYYDIDLEKHVRKYTPQTSRTFSSYVYNPLLRKAINEFYGIVRGFSIDSIVSKEETEYIAKWRSEHAQYANYREIGAIINTIDTILEDEVITLDELTSLHVSIKSYLDLVNTAPVTLATQILDGILKGIVIDGEVTEAECKNLRLWLYDNIYLSDHFPFNKALELIEKVLEDSVITKEESAFLTNVINDLLNPVQALTKQVNSAKDKHVCLSGNFSYGTKAKVEQYIISQGGLIDSNVKKTTDLLIIGNNECQAYSNGSYGTKVKKALEFNEKGAHIQIIKEADFILE